MAAVQINKFTLFSLILLGVFFCGEPFVTYAAAECRWTEVKAGLYCSTVMGNIEWQAADATRCGTPGQYGYQCCCGPQLKKEVKVSPKFKIIGAIVAFFTILTTITLISRKND